MSLLKVNEVQNYNGSSLTLTASTVSTSAQLNTGGNISVTGSINVSDDSTTRSNLGLGSIATQDSSNVTITGGNISNATLASTNTFPAGHIVQSVIPATIGNVDTSLITAQSTPGGFGDVINQITIQSGNGVLIYLHVGVQITASGNCFGGVLICEGTVSSVGTSLAADAPGSGETINRVFYTNLWAYDSSPASTTPSYVFAFSKGSVSTSGQSIYVNNALHFYCHLYEVQQ